MSDGDRCAALERVLRDAGIAARVSAAGPASELAVVRGAPPGRLAPFADRARALGFRYLTIDLSALPDAPA